MAEGSGALGWIGTGRMGYRMAERLLRAGHALQVWNRTRAKAEPLGALGATICDSAADLAGVDVLFTMVGTGADLEQVLFGAGGVTSGGAGMVPRTVVDCSSIGVDQGAALRARLAERGTAMIAAPVSGNAKCVPAGKLSAVCSGPQAAFRKVEPLVQTFACRGVAYVGEGELARFCKIAHNVMLGVVIQNLAEITVLAQKAGVPRHAFLEFINNSVMGSQFSRYKTPALVKLDWTPTFTPVLLRKDLDLGIKSAKELGVQLPVTKTARAEVDKLVEAGHTDCDFAILLEQSAAAAGMKLKPENIAVDDGLKKKTA
jgi:3-hydroxyisobutyrate dehydrogenase